VERRGLRGDRSRISRLAEVMGDRALPRGDAEVLQRHSGLWFLDESFVISRKRD